jgi:hypothetical protein
MRRSDATAETKAHSSQNCDESIQKDKVRSQGGHKVSLPKSFCKKLNTVNDEEFRCARAKVFETKKEYSLTEMIDCFKTL